MSQEYKDWDWTLTFKNRYPYALGDKVQSPCKDDMGQIIHFPGRAYVSKLQTIQTTSPDFEVIYYIQQFLPIDVDWYQNIQVK